MAGESVRGRRQRRLKSKNKKSPGLVLRVGGLFFRTVLNIDTIVDKDFPDHSGCSLDILVLLLHG